MRRWRGGDMDGIGCVVIALLAIVAMPLVGVYLYAKGEKGLGTVLIVVGIVIYLIMAMSRG